MITVVCFKWYRADSRYTRLFRYTGQYVNVLRSMLRRHLSLPHELVCVTDDPEGIDPDVRIVELPKEVRDWPGCCQRLMIFRADAAEIFGPRILLMDLDCVILRSIDHLLEGLPDFKIWEPRLYYMKSGRYSRYNMSFVLLKAGARRQVWDYFTPERANDELTAAGLEVDDQSWVTRTLGPNEQTWPWDGEIRSLKATSRPTDASIVFFNGPRSPAMPEVRREYPWIERHWK